MNGEHANPGPLPSGAATRVAALPDASHTLELGLVSSLSMPGTPSNEGFHHRLCPVPVWAGDLKCDADRVISLGIVAAE